MVRQHRFISVRASAAWTMNLYGIRAGRKTINNQLLSRVYCAYSPIKKLLLIANHHRLRLKWAQGWQNLTMAHWQHVIFGDESRFQFYLVDGRLVVCRLPGERFQQRCQANLVQTGSGWVHVWGAFHSCSISPLEPLDRYLTWELYMGILRDNLVAFVRQHFGDNYYDDNTTTHHARVFLDIFSRAASPRWSNLRDRQTATP